jgi:hypothetical protein
MLQYVVPGLVIVLSGTSYGLARARSKAMREAKTPERMATYQVALVSVRDPNKLRELADAFDEVGMREEADNLRGRAALRLAPPELQAARKEVFRKLMSCTDPAKVIEGANAFSKIRAYAAASDLRKYASGLMTEDVNILSTVINDMRDKCQLIPETGQVRSLATRSALKNLETRKKELLTTNNKVSPKDAARS